MALDPTLDPTLDTRAIAPPELHIASLVVYSTPRRLQTVLAALADMPGAEVHGAQASGKLVLTLEAAWGGQMMDKVSQVQGLDGVLSATLVYQCADTLDAMNEEIADAAGQT